MRRPVVEGLARSRALTGLLLLVALAGCPSSRDAVEGAVEAGFACTSSAPSEGQCPDGAVCGLENRCHARVSGAWACDPAANAVDGTNVHCFGEPLDVCGADSKCHAADEKPGNWACNVDAQCRNGRRCSEASWTCVETTSEALLPSPRPPEGTVEVLPSWIAEGDASALIAASTPTAACTGRKPNGSVDLRLPVHCYLGAVDNRIQAFASVEGGMLRTRVLGQRPIGGNTRAWLESAGVDTVDTVPLARPIAAGLLGVELVRPTSSSASGGTLPKIGVVPLVTWVDDLGQLSLRATPTFTTPEFYTVAAFPGAPPAGAELRLFSTITDPFGSYQMADVLIRTPAEVLHVGWTDLERNTGPLLSPVQVFPATTGTGPLEDVVQLPSGKGLMVVTEKGTFHQSYVPAGAVPPGWRTGQSLTALHDVTSGQQLSLNALLTGPRELRFHATTDSAFLVLTVRSTDPSAPTFMTLPSTRGNNCGLGGTSDDDSMICFRNVCEPCATARGERVVAAGWVPEDSGGPPQFLVRCASESGVRTLQLRFMHGAEGPTPACVFDTRTDALARDARPFSQITRANAWAFNDSHNLVSAMPLPEGAGELIATGLDRPPHGLARVNGKLAAFTTSRTWQRELDKYGVAKGGFLHSPVAEVSLLSAVEAPAAFTRTLLLASVRGEASVMDVTDDSSDMFPVAAFFKSATGAVTAQHHGVVVQARASFAAPGMSDAFTLFITRGDSLLGADVSSMMGDSLIGAMEELTVRLTPQPGSDVRSVAFTEPVGDLGEPLFARGFLLTTNGLFGFDAGSPNRFRSYALPSRDVRWVGLYTEGAPLASLESPARARLAYADGVVVSLPSQVPLTGPLPTRNEEGAGDALVSVLHHCGHTYGLSERTLFHLTATPGQPLGVWEDLLGNADAESLPFKGGTLLRDGDTLYLFGSAGHTRTWTAPTCPRGP